MSETPRTDEREFAAIDLKPSARVVYASFARQLEIECAETQADADHWKGECNALQRMVHEARAEAEQMQTAFKEILRIQRTVDLNLFDIEQVHSIAEAALAAAERRRWEGNE